MGAKLRDEENAMSSTSEYQYLESRPRSNYRQLWVKGRHIRAEVLYRHTIGAEPRSPEEVADDYGLPLAAVHEAIGYCLRHQSLLDAERSREEQRLRESGLDPLRPVSDPASR
jgi:uncharacterized protein (DUF433 family)